MGLWIGLEFVLRDGGVLLLMWLLLPRPITPVPWERVVGFSAFMVVVATLVLGWVFVRKVFREGVSWSEIGYDWSRGALTVGVLGGVALVWVTGHAALLDDKIFRDPSHAQLAFALRNAGSLTRGALVLGNGLLGPVVEELAWRGYVQTRLAAAWPHGRALVVTALAFSVKHMIVDVSVSRALMLGTAALVLGLIRAHRGTSASTVAHVVMNLQGTLLVIVSQHSAP